MSDLTGKKKILVAPLNWGLGHASRCIPLIRALLEQQFEPLLASDGAALELLRQEFPALKSYQLPPYDIGYTKKGKWMPFKLLSQVPAVMTAAYKEKRIVQELVEREGLAGIISDNRFGVCSTEVPSVYLTHQLKVFSGPLTPLTTAVHASIIRKFDQCWVCDFEGEMALAGRLSHDASLKNLKYIGPLSRFEQGADSAKDIDIAFVLSGPEPQRSVFQGLIEGAFADHPSRMVLVEGKMSHEREKRIAGNLEVYNYLLSSELKDLLVRSSVVVSRSGYSTIMDLHALGSRAFFVPTPGQSEQEYLARYIKMRGIAGFEEQDEFCAESIEESVQYSGFNKAKTPNKNQFHGLFDVF